MVRKRPFRSEGRGASGVFDRGPSKTVVPRCLGLLAAALFLLLTRPAAAQNSPAASPTSLPKPSSSAPILRARDVPNTFGTTQTSYQRVGVTEFVPVNSSLTYSDLAVATNTWSRYPTNVISTDAFAATAHLPSGALLDAVEFDYCDSNAGADISGYVEVTSYTGEVTSVPGSGASAGAPGCSAFVADMTPAPVQVDNELSQVLLLVNIPAHDGTLSISGAILRYHLQVSPAPAAATFTDVPTSDFGFQFIEALAASGITGGCGGGKFCPDNPVTRRQMAIFLAKALGLQWN